MRQHPKPGGRDTGYKSLLIVLWLLYPFPSLVRVLGRGGDRVGEAVEHRGTIAGGADRGRGVHDRDFGGVTRQGRDHPRTVGLDGGLATLEHRGAAEALDVLDRGDVAGGDPVGE